MKVVLAGSVFCIQSYCSQRREQDRSLARHRHFNNSARGVQPLRMARGAELGERSAESFENTNEWSSRPKGSRL